jgi:uncharacterized protein YbjQ (UPF0145 family)
MEDKPDWASVVVDDANHQTDGCQASAEKAFFVAVQELKKRASSLGADAIICMRQSLDLDINSVGLFYLHIYGIAVKMK